MEFLTICLALYVFIDLCVWITNKVEERAERASMRRVISKLNEEAAVAKSWVQQNPGKNKEVDELLKQAQDLIEMLERHLERRSRPSSTLRDIAFSLGARRRTACGNFSSAPPPSFRP